MATGPVGMAEKMLPDRREGPQLGSKQKTSMKDKTSQTCNADTGSPQCAEQPEGVTKPPFVFVLPLCYHVVSSPQFGDVAHQHVQPEGHRAYHTSSEAHRARQEDNPNLTPSGACGKSSVGGAIPDDSEIEKFYSHSWWFQELYHLYSDLGTFQFLAVKHEYDETRGPVDLELLVKADDEVVTADVAGEDVANYITQHKYNAPSDHWLQNLNMGFNLRVRLLDYNQSSVLKDFNFLCGDKTAYEEYLEEAETSEGSR